MQIVDRLWRQQLDCALGSIGDEQPEQLKIRVFGAPAVAQQRLAEAIEALRMKSYVFADTSAVATSPWFTVTDVRFARETE